MSFNTASGKSLHATLCPGSRGNTGLKMGFWKTYGLFAVFWKFFLWTLFHFVKKLCFYSLPHKALKCPQTFWKSNALFITVSILLFALFCQIFLARFGWKSEQIRRFLSAVRLIFDRRRRRILPCPQRAELAGKKSASGRMKAGSRCLADSCG